MLEVENNLRTNEALIVIGTFFVLSQMTEHQGKDKDTSFVRKHQVGH